MILLFSFELGGPAGKKAALRVLFFKNEQLYPAACLLLDLGFCLDMGSNEYQAGGDTGMLNV